jgi:spore germination protein KB
MIKDTRISGYQLSLLMMGFIFGSTTIVTPAATAGQDAWLAFILGWLGGFLLMWLYVTISLDNPSRTLIEILRNCFGKYLGSVLALLYIAYFLHLASFVFRDYGEYLALTTYTLTPMAFTIGCFALLVAYCLKKGLEVTGRAAEILIPYLFIVVIITFVVLIPEYKLKNFTPILENGLAPVADASLRVLTFPFGETVIFLMIFPILYSVQKIKSTAFLSVLIMGFFLLSGTVREVLSLGPDLLTRLVFPPSLSTELTSKIQFDPLIGVNLLLGGWIKVTVCLYAAVVGITQLLELDDYRPFVLPAAILTVGLSLWTFNNIFEQMYISQKLYYYYVIPFQVIIPVLILVITKLKKVLKAK